MLHMFSCEGARATLNEPIVLRQHITSFFSKVQNALPHQNVALKVIHANLALKSLLKVVSYNLYILSFYRG